MYATPLKTMIQPTAMETPMPVARGRHSATTPNRIMTTPHPMEAPAASLKMPVVLCAFIFDPPNLACREMRA